MRRKKPMDNLTRDAIAAQKAGMSYGKYKALHPNTRDDDEKEEIVLPGEMSGNWSAHSAESPF